MIPSYDKKINRKVRVFISSTFSDMQSERNIIVNSVFPRLRKTFDARQIDINEVDLRWGIPEEDSESSKILEICIGEVLHCSPFFVGMVGNRYGTLASDESINNLPPAYRKALGENLPSGLSITELEMRAGAFVPKNVDFSCFFIKKSLINSKEIPIEVSKLIDNINASYESYTYSDGKEFEEQLYNSLHRYILKVIPEKLMIPYDDKSYFSHLKILKNNNYRYEPDLKFIAEIERKINKYHRTYILGHKGIGKSACVSYLIKREGIDRDGKVFFHFATAGSQSINIDNVFFRLRLFLQSESGYVSKEEDSYNAVVDILHYGTLSERIVLFIDALDQLDDVTAIYKFFSLADLNENIYVLCSGTAQFSRIFGDQISVMKPLSPDQISQITNGTLSRFGKKLSRKMIRDIIKKENCSNPLFLRAFLSQLIMYGTYDTFDSFFYKLLECEKFDQLFSVVIARVKNYFEESGIDSNQVYSVLALIICSYNGVKESEIQEILNILPVAKSVLLTAIELFIIEDNGLIRFNHDLIISATKKILKTADEQYEIKTSKLFIEYFLNQPAGWRKYSELPYQLCQLNKMDNLLEQISDNGCFMYLCRYGYHSIIGYLSHLIDKQDVLSKKLTPNLSENDKIKTARIMCIAGCHNSAISIVSDILEKETNADLKIQLMDILARSQYKLSLNHFQTSIETYHKLISYYRSVYPEDEVGCASRKYLLGVAYKSSGQISTSIDILKECADIYIKHNVCNATSLWVLDVYGATLYAEGKIKKAIEILDMVISDCQYLFGEISSELAWSYCYGWNTLYAIGDKTNAISMVNKAYDIYEQLYMGRGTKIAWAAGNAGTAAMIMGNYELAKKYYLFSIEENDCIIPQEDRPHVYSLTLYANFAILYTRTKNIDKAREAIEKALINSSKKNGDKHIYTGNIMLIYGIIENDCQKIENAISIYRMQSFDTPDLYFAQVCLARMYVINRRIEKASEVINQCFKEYFEKFRETDLITYLILDSLEKICGNLTEDMADELDELYRFDDYDYYLTHNNNSQIIPIPKI